LQRMRQIMNRNKNRHVSARNSTLSGPSDADRFCIQKLNTKENEMNWTTFKKILQQIDQAIEEFVRETVDELEKTYQSE